MQNGGGGDNSGANKDSRVRRKAQETLDEMVAHMGLEEYGMDTGNGTESNGKDTSAATSKPKAAAAPSRKPRGKKKPVSGPGVPQQQDEEDEDDGNNDDDDDDDDKSEDERQKRREEEERAQEAQRKKMYAHFQKRGIADRVSPEGIVDFADIVNDAERPVIPGISHPEEVAAAAARAGTTVDIRSLQNQIMELQYAENFKRNQDRDTQKRKHRMLIFFEMFLDPEVETHGEAWQAFQAQYQQAGRGTMIAANNNSRQS